MDFHWGRLIAYMALFVATTCATWKIGKAMSNGE